MKYTSAKGFSGWAQLGILIAFLGAGVIVTALVQLAILFSIVPPGTALANHGQNAMDALMKPEHSFALQLSQVLGTFFLMFLPAVSYMLVCHGKNFLWLGFSKRVSLWQLFLACAIMLSAELGAGLLSDLSKSLLSHSPGLLKWAQEKEDFYNTQALAISNIRPTVAGLIGALFMMALLPGLFEELLFRGALQNLLVRWMKRPLIAIIISSVVFSLVHGTVFSFLSRALLGFGLGWMFFRGKNIWINIMAHFFNNALAVVQLYILARNNEKPTLENTGQPSPVWFGLLFIVLFIALLVLFDRVSKRNRAAIAADEEKLYAETAAAHKLTSTRNPFE